ncbi:MAG: DUF4214 domain-containing protein, partial [Clostridiales bacterium]|nr:DUF4214 domain-containing protein [Clostridiales bacterium]
GWSFADTTTSVGNAGTNTFEATFTPEDTTNYNIITEDVKVAVSPIDPEYTVPTGLTADYGQTLADVELPEGWSFADTTTSVGNAGTNTFTATFTPADTTNYNTITDVDVEITVSPIDPEYTVPTGLTADYGQTLADVELPEGWSFADTTTSVGNAGTNTFEATFTPEDTTNYNIITEDVEVAVSPIDPEYTVPTGLTATYGQTLADVKLPDGWAFADATASVGNAGTNTFKATFTPKDATNYNTISNVEVKVTVAKADATVKTAPTAIALTENGSAQALVNAGAANNGTMQYAIGTDAKTAPTSGYSTTIPTGTAAGTYYVWYKVVGSANYNDSKASCVTVTIAAKPAETGVAGFVERLYTIALGRESDPDGKAYWVDCVNTKGSTGADVARGFLFSPEFIDSNMSDSDFVEVLYKTFFDRASEPEGKAFWLDSLAKGTSKKEVINGFINSPEWQEICKSYGIPSGAAAETESGVVAFATRLYTTCLGREPEADGLKYWSEELSNKRVTGTSAAYGFFFSKEFKDKNLSNEEYVKSLYRTFMGREFDKEGLAYWVGLLNNNASRESVFYGFAQSAEFGEICASYGILR